MTWFERQIYSQDVWYSSCMVKTDWASILVHITPHCPAQWGGGSVEGLEDPDFYCPVKQNHTEHKSYYEEELSTCINQPQLSKAIRTVFGPHEIYRTVPTWATAKGSSFCKPHWEADPENCIIIWKSRINSQEIQWLFQFEVQTRTCLECCTLCSFRRHQPERKHVGAGLRTLMCRK